MKISLSRPKRSLASAVISCLLLAAIFATSYAAPVAAGSGCAISGETNFMTGGGPELMVNPTGVSVNSSEINMTPVKNPNSISGAVLSGGLHSAADNGSTLNEFYREDSAMNFFGGAFGIAGDSYLNSLTLETILASSTNEIIELYHSYEAKPSESSVLKKSQSLDYNPVERMINEPLNLALGIIKTNEPKLSAIISAAQEDYTLTEVLDNSVSKAALMGAVSAASGISAADVADAPLNSIITKTADRVAPKEGGAKYTDSLDVFIYQMQEQENLNITGDTLVSDFLRDLILMDGKFTGEANPRSYPSIYYISGVADPQADLIISLGVASIEAVERNLYFEYDGDILTAPRVELVQNDKTGEITATIHGIFAQAGYHSLHMVHFFSPYYFHIDLQEQAVPVTGITLKPASAQLEVGLSKGLNAAITPANATNKAISWSSDNPGVATVDDNGIVTAVAEGTATITAATADGGKTATCSITVIPRKLTFFRRILKVILDILITIFKEVC